MQPRLRCRLNLPILLIPTNSYTHMRKKTKSRLREFSCNCLICNISELILRCPHSCHIWLPFSGRATPMAFGGHIPRSLLRPSCGSGVVLECHAQVRLHFARAPLRARIKWRRFQSELNTECAIICCVTNSVFKFFKET